MLAVENYINLLCASLLITAFILINFDETLWSFFVYLMASLWILGLVTLITFISSLLNVLFKDTNYVLHFLFTILYFMTPTFFYVENLPQQFQKILQLNPFFWIISLFRLRDISQQTFFILAINLIIMLTWLR